MKRTFLYALVAAVGATLSTMTCTPPDPSRLDELPTVELTIKGQPFRLWVADSFSEQNDGLKKVTAEQMAPLPDGTERGMLFVFDHSVRTSFWMKDTIIPLDIAYVSTNVTVVSTYTMAPLDDRHNGYPPSAPYRYAVEVMGNRFDELGLEPGDVLAIPTAVLKGTR